MRRRIANRWAESFAGRRLIDVRWYPDPEQQPSVGWAFSRPSPSARVTYWCALVVLFGRRILAVTVMARDRRRVLGKIAGGCVVARRCASLN